MYVTQTKSETECMDHRFPLEQRRTFPQLADNYFYYKTMSLGTKSSAAQLKINNLELDKQINNFNLNPLQKIVVPEVQGAMCSQQENDKGNIRSGGMTKYFGTKHNSFEVEKATETTTVKYNKYINANKSWECERGVQGFSSTNGIYLKNIEDSNKIPNIEAKVDIEEIANISEPPQTEQMQINETQLIQITRPIANNFQTAINYSEIKVLFQYQQKTESLQTEGRTNVSCDTDRRLTKQNSILKKIFSKMFCCATSKTD